MMQKPVFKHRYFLLYFILVILIIIMMLDSIKHIQAKVVSTQSEQQISPKLTLSNQELAWLIRQANVTKVAPPKINNQDIFLPSHTSAIDLLNNKPSAISNTSFERCRYNNQTYVLGDIVKTDQGWMRCTPTIDFAETSATTSQNGEAVWTKVQ